MKIEGFLNDVTGIFERLFEGGFLSRLIGVLLAPVALIVCALLLPLWVVGGAFVFSVAHVILFVAFGSKYDAFGYYMDSYRGL